MTLKLQFDPNQPYQLAHVILSEAKNLYPVVRSQSLLHQTALSDEAKVELADQCNLRMI